MQEQGNKKLEKEWSFSFYMNVYGPWMDGWLDKLLSWC